MLTAFALSAVVHFYASFEAPDGETMWGVRRDFPSMESCRKFEGLFTEAAALGSFGQLTLVATACEYETVTESEKKEM